MFKINDEILAPERFPDGTYRLNISAISPQEATIKWLFEKDEEMLLLFIVRHLRERCKVRKMTLYMPYIPHARMDRVKSTVEVFTLKYFCEYINSLLFDAVIVRDAHSPASLALLNNVTVESMEKNITELSEKLLNRNRDIIFYPDEGSCKRYSELLSFPYAFGTKKREWSTGSILGLEVQGDIPKEPYNVLIVDDISSYGGTFLYSARKLKELGANKVYLYVTHCENSILKGDLIKSGLIEKIYTTASIFNEEHPLIEIIGEK